MKRPTSPLSVNRRTHSKLHLNGLSYRRSSHARPSWPELLCLAVLFSVAGCGGSDELTVVRGRVLLDGSPLPHGSVSTLPDHGRGAVGVINDDGRFELSTRGVGNGLRPGTHRVAIVAFRDPTGKSLEGRRDLLTPARYSSPATSGLSIDVVPGESSDVTLELTSRVDQ